MHRRYPGIPYGVPHACYGCLVVYNLYALPGEHVQQAVVQDGTLKESEVLMALKGFHVFLLYLPGIVGMEIIQAYYLMAILKEPFCYMGAYEARASGKQDFHVIKIK